LNQSGNHTSELPYDTPDVSIVSVEISGSYLQLQHSLFSLASASWVIGSLCYTDVTTADIQAIITLTLKATVPNVQLDTAPKNN